MATLFRGLCTAASYVPGRDEGGKVRKHLQKKAEVESDTDTPCAALAGVPQGGRWESFTVVKRVVFGLFLCVVGVASLSAAMGWLLANLLSSNKFTSSHL